MHTTEPLSVDNIITLAERESGAFGIIDNGLRQRVADIVNWINQHGPYSIDQTLAMQRQIQHVLASRLQIGADRKFYPDIAETSVQQPIFVIGFARAGTTLLHALLAEDPQSLAPLAWHSRMPSPPPGHIPPCSGRIAYAQQDVQDWINYCPGQLKLHPYADCGAYQLIEDEELLTLDFRNAYPSLLYKVPTLDVKVVLGENYLPAVQWHKQVVQHLMWKSGKNRWVSKFSTAQQDLAALFEVYPDALCVWAHRPISEIYASNVAIRAATFDTINGEAKDWTSQAEARARQMKAAVDQMMANDIINDSRILHLPFHELAINPIATIEKIYQYRGLALSTDYRDRMQSWLDNPENKIDRYGRYNYAYDAFGLDKSWVKSLFAEYSERFGLKEHDEDR